MIMVSEKRLKEIEFKLKELRGDVSNIGKMMNMVLERLTNAKILKKENFLKEK